MNKLNDLGLELIEYKKELRKEHSNLVKEALFSSLDEMVKSEIVDRGISELVKNNDFEVVLLEEQLLKSEKYSKSPEEIKEEMEEIIGEFKEEFNLSNLNSVDFKVDTDKEHFIMVKTLGFDESFVLKYFEVEKSELPKLMEQKGFIEKFAALRLKKVASTIASTLSKEKTLILRTSSPYINHKSNGYNVDILYEITLNDILEEKNHTKKAIEDISSISDEMYGNMMEF